jgi:hypothetical protein
MKRWRLSDQLVFARQTRRPLRWRLTLRLRRESKLPCGLAHGARSTVTPERATPRGQTGEVQFDEREEGCVALMKSISVPPERRR